jgi:phosphoglucomutase
MYFELVGKPCPIGELPAAKRRLSEVCHQIEKAFMTYCYGLIGVDFPERGFLLFWQLPLKDKLRYFEVEDEIAALTDIPEPGRRAQELSARLAFLGANPVQKVDRAFAARFGKGLAAYLGLPEQP